MKLKLQRPLVVLDIEATGINIITDRIVEIALVKYRPDGAQESISWRLNPEMAIPQEVSEIHGISDADVAEAPSFKEIAMELRDWIDGCDLAGYNSNRFDIPMLMEEFLRAEIGFDENRNFIDVQRIFMKKEPRTLGAAYRFFCDEELVDAHSAMADAKATGEVLLAQLERYEDLPVTAKGLADFSSDGQFVDNTRRMVVRNGEEYFNFGKHRGKKVVDVLNEEPSYFDWIQKGVFSRHLKLKLQQIRLRMKTSRS